jgi:putative FmdB family regulatory protein
MPIYEYRCRNGHVFEVVHGMADDPVASCEQCSASVERVFHPVAVHFKGPGFYTTDYARKGAKAGDDGGPDTKKDDAKKDDKKKDSGTGTGDKAKTKAASD